MLMKIKYTHHTDDPLVSHAVTLLVLATISRMDKTSLKWHLPCK